MKCRMNGVTRADVVVLLLVVCGVLAISFCLVLPAYQREWRHENRRLCGVNLSEIGKAMVVYANDYDGVLPIAGGPGTVWGAGLSNWKANSCGEAFGLDPNGAGGQATVSASLYLLVKYTGLSPESFVCRKDKGTTGFRPEKYAVDANDLADLWDFGPDPARHCTYAYQLPYSPYRLKTLSEPGMPVVADRNPWIDGPRQKAAQFSSFKPDISPFNGTSEEGLQGNSLVHRTRQGPDGQNVLYLDGHVEFARRASCGLEDDNVYTSWDGRDRIRGVSPKPYESRPAHEFDSLLVNDPPLDR